MPRTIKIYDDPRPVATEQELLDFANAIRQAGGADVLEALLPSRQSDGARCLIATALNFGCTVDMGEGEFADGSYKWVMHLPFNLTSDQRKAIASVQGVRLRKDLDGDYFLTLPKHIGNAAYAFDSGDAFQEYVR